MKSWEKFSLGSTPSPCACAVDYVSSAFSAHEKVLVPSFCSKCLGTRVNLQAWDVSLWIRPDTYMSMVESTQTYEDPFIGSAPATVRRFRLHCGLQVQVVVAAELHYLEDQVDHKVVGYLRQIAHQIGMPSRRALLLRLTELEHKYAAHPDVFSGKIGDYSSVPVFAPTGVWSVGSLTLETDPSAGIVVPRDLKTLIPGLAEAGVVDCPATCSSRYPLISLVQHLNDKHKWTREAIADWLDCLDADLSFATPDTTAA